MSDVSVLSHEYRTTSGLSQDINRALVVLKRVRLGLPGAEAVTREQIDAGRCALIEILCTLRNLLDPTEAARIDSAAAGRIPGSLVARLQTARRGDLAYYLEDLEGVATRLRQDVPALTDSDLALLQELALAADAETSRVYRRLMRR